MSISTVCVIGSYTNEISSPASSILELGVKPINNGIGMPFVLV